MSNNNPQYTARIGAFAISNCTKKAPTFNTIANSSNSQYVAGARPYAQTWKLIREGRIPQKSTVSVHIPASAFDMASAEPIGPRTNDFLFRSHGFETTIVVPRTSEQFVGQEPFVVTEDARSYLFEPRRENVPDSPVAITDDASTSTVAVGGDPLPSPAQYKVHILHHPFICDALDTVSSYGPFGILDPVAIGRGDQTGQKDWAYQSQSDAIWNDTPQSHETISTPRPMATVDFSPGSSMGLYNWELFFHAPILVAKTLSSSGRYEEANAWFKSIFEPNPRSSGTTTGIVDPLFKVKPLSDTTSHSAQTFATALMDGTLDAEEVEQLSAQVSALTENPFDPFAIGMGRPIAMKKAVVLAYMEHLIEWADSLFRQDTRETVNEALTLYLEAEELLGSKPFSVGVDGSSSATIDEVRETIGERADAMETILSSDVVGLPQHAVNGSPQPLPVSLASGTFCLPRNERFDVLWDTVRDRLDKIRTCRSIDGVQRDLAFFQPPLDPALLIRAGGVPAGGLEDMGSAMPIYRFRTLAGRAKQSAELARSLSQSLLSAIANRDGEALQRIRTTHQTSLLDLQKETRRIASNEAREQLAGIRQQITSAEAREAFYTKQLERGVMDDEQSSLDLRRTATLVNAAGSVALGVASVLDAIGEVEVGVPPKVVTGPAFIGQSLRTANDAANLTAMVMRAEADILGTKVSWARRAEDWGLQRTLAAQEVKQLTRQEAAAEMRVQMADREYAIAVRNHANISEERAYFETKFTNEQLYAWMTEQAMHLSRLAYQEADRAVGMAEAAYNTEIRPSAESDLVADESTGWDSARLGLMGADALLVRIEQLENAYMRNHTRLVEATKSVSIERLDPMALANLRTKGTCEVTIPEALFDMDFPTHLRRRMRNVLVSIPCTTGRYSDATATLQLTSSSVVDKDASGNIQIVDDVDPVDPQVALSTSRDDGGLFRPSIDDARYLPFEYRGVNATWKLTLSGGEDTEYTGTPQFDWMTIADVVFTIQYEAESGGSATAAKSRVDNWASDSLASQATIQSLRQDAPDAWHRMTQSQTEFQNRYGLSFGTETGANATHFVVNDANVGAFDLSQDWTMAYWFRQNAIGQPHMVSKWDASGDGFIMYRVWGETDITLFFDEGGSRYIRVFSGPDLGEWAHLAIVNTAHNTLDPTNLKLYVNGVEANVVTNSAAGVFQGTTNYHGVPLRLGGSTDGTHSPSCDYDELVIYNDRALSTAEIERLIDEGTTATPAAAAPIPTPSHYWPLGDDPRDRQSSASQTGTLNPTRLHDQIAGADFVELGTQASGAAMLLEHPTFTTTRPVDVTIPISNAEMPYAMQQLAGQPGKQMTVAKVNIWYIYDEAYDTFADAPTADRTAFGPIGNNVTLHEAGPTAPTHEFVTDAKNVLRVELTVPVAAGTSLQDLQLHFDDVPESLVDIVAVVDWTISGGTV